MRPLLLCALLSSLAACDPEQPCDCDGPDDCQPCDTGPADCPDTDTDTEPVDTGETAAPGDDCPACVADFAIYDAEEEDDGVWEDEVTALQALMDAYGWSYETVGARDINQGSLAEGEGRRYRAIVAPGGSAYYRDLATTEEGEDLIRAFLSSGGGYVGFCAGTSWTADTIVWAEHATGGGGSYNRPGDYATYSYDLGVFQGAIQAPFGWEPWGEGLRVSLEPAALDLGIPTLSAIGVPAETRLFYYGGPVYQPTGTPADYEVWARAVAPEGLPADALTGAGEPTIVRYSYGTGTVVLFSYHPVVLVGSMVDDLKLGGLLDEDAITWETGDQTQDEINLQSWNILHGALQLVAGWEPTPIAALP